MHCRLGQVVQLWRSDLSKINPRAAEALADPAQYANLFPNMDLAVKAEQHQVCTWSICHYIADLERACSFAYILCMLLSYVVHDMDLAALHMHACMLLVILFMIWVWLGSWSDMSVMRARWLMPSSMLVASRPA